jgi:hypothetical protein
MIRNQITASIDAMTASASPLATIPVVDIAPGGLVRHAVESADRAQLLRDECLSGLPRAARLILPAMDALTRRWLARSASPYVGEIGAIAAALAAPGIWFLNGCYEWGCTALARDEGGVPWLARTLDWPFFGLGRHVEIARMQGSAGSFAAVTWPGFAGVLNAMAPGRFAASINQAPLWRRTRRPWLRPFDMALNALATGRVRFMPPDHLLRHVFETCGSFAEARRRLETVPVARPVIFTLAGCMAGENCVIERTEEQFMTRNTDTSAANDWLPNRTRWEARVSSTYLFSRTFAEAAEKSSNRRGALAAWQGSLSRGGFDWVVPPVLNPFTRVAVEMCPAKGVLRAVGYEKPPGSDLAEPVTQPREFPASGVSDQVSAIRYQ